MSEKERVQDWLDCLSRRPWVANGLRHEIGHLRRAANKHRSARRGEMYRDPSLYIADVLDEAADSIQRRLNQIEPTPQREEG